MGDQNPTTIPTAFELANANLTTKQWLTYYLNIWKRNAVARTIDVFTDQKLKDADADQEVESRDTLGRTFLQPVAERLEERKILLQDALDIVYAIEQLLINNEESFEKTYWSKEALAVAPDVIAKRKEQEELNKKPEEPASSPADAAALDA